MKFDINDFFAGLGAGLTTYSDEAQNNSYNDSDFESGGMQNFDDGGPAIIEDTYTDYTIYIIGGIVILIIAIALYIKFK